MRIFRALVAVVLLLPGVAAAQNLIGIDDTDFREAFEEARLQELPGITAAGADADKLAAVYERIIGRMAVALAPLQTRLRNAIVSFAGNTPDSTAARSFDAPLSNPGTNALFERSGATDLLAFVANQKLFASDRSSVSINLSAFAFAHDALDGKQSAQIAYGRREHLRRLTGTVSFGAQLPERELTGVHGLPSSDMLFDAYSWDVKLRVYGDRDPRASRWRPLLLADAGFAVELATRLSGLAPTVDEKIAARAAAEQRIGGVLHSATQTISRSLQISVKAAGQHLDAAKLLNKYSFAVMLDKGFGVLDLTANAVYASADGPASALPRLFRTNDLQLAAGLTGSVLKGVFVANRAVELSAGLSGLVPLDSGDVVTERRKVVKVNTAVVIPFGEKAKIPLSITYSNDPNNLSKDKYVTGQIGISYDFNALWSVK